MKSGETFKEVNPDDSDHMHGIATTSLLTNVAKDSEIHFFSGTIEDYVQYIINHNENCEEKDKILVASGSWRDKNFTTHRDELRKHGCELVCTDNFDKNFNEFTSDIEGKPTGCPIDFSEEEINELIEINTKVKLIGALKERAVNETLEKPENKNKSEEEIREIRREVEKKIEAQYKDKTIAQIEEEFDPETRDDIKNKAKEQVENQAAKKDNVKIPISRTYYQVGENGIVSKYQSIYSTSWGVPQVAGLLAIFKQQYRDLTFEQFCDLARESAKDNEMKIIDVEGMYKLISDRERTQSSDETIKKDGTADVFQDNQVKTSSATKAKQCIESERIGATIENTQENDNVKEEP